MEDPSQQGKRPRTGSHLSTPGPAGLTKASVKSGATKPVLCGTDSVAVELVAALAAGQVVNATLEDHPDRTREQDEAAADYARAYPKTGRSYPPRSLK